MKDNFNEYIDQTPVDLSFPEPARRFIAGVLPVFLICLFGIQSANRSEVRGLLLGALVFSAITGILTIILIPPTWSGWVKYSLPTVGIFIFALLLMLLQQVKPKAQNPTALEPKTGES